MLKVIHQPKRFAKLTSMWGARDIIKVWVRVHKGFYTAWRKNDFNEILLSRVGDILSAMPAPSVATVLVTGHSLGGALATLGAHDMRTRFPNTHVAVYTFGSPRVGNRALALEYNDLVPEHFSVINDQDPVARVPKRAYKRVGNRVIVNSMGDIIVRPGFLEMKVINHAAAGDVSHHFLKAYRSSIMSVIQSQFTGRQMQHGREGAQLLATTMNLDSALLAVNMDLESLKCRGVECLTIEEAQRQEDRVNKKQSSFAAPWQGICGCGTGAMSRQGRQAAEVVDPHAEEVHLAVVEGHELP